LDSDNCKSSGKNGKDSNKNSKDNNKNGKGGTGRNGMCESVRVSAVSTGQCVAVRCGAVRV
jgi:hypothetical protein